MDTQVAVAKRVGVTRYAKPFFFVLLLLVLALFPQLSPPGYWRSVLIEVLIFGIFAMSLDLLLGYTGMISFGHAMFFGAGAYIVGWVGMHISQHIVVTLGAALIGAAILAVAVGYISIRTSGVYFLMLTLAFSQMLYAIAHQWTWLTGGSNGMAGIPRPVFDIFGAANISFGKVTNFYYLVLVFFALSALLMYRIINSPFGRTLIGIRENENRMRAVGYNTRSFKLAVFVIAGVFGSLAGALYGYYNGFISPQELYWTMSGQVMIMVIMGGAGTLAGPVLGAGVMLLLQNMVSSLTERWPMIMGVIFILFVLVARKGIAGLATDIWMKVGRRP